MNLTTLTFTTLDPQPVQASHRNVQAELASAMGISAEAVYAAVGEEGARILLEALRAQPRYTITTCPAAPAPLLSELDDAMAR